MELEYADAERIFNKVSCMVADATGVPVDRNMRSENGLFQSGLYNARNDRIVVGVLPLTRGMVRGSVSGVDCVSMCKQAVHEYRHWQQRQLFAGLSHNAAQHGCPSLSFGDDMFCRTMARQKLIASEFPAYQSANQFVLSYERDAEEYAIYATPTVLSKAGFPAEHIEPCMIAEINRRTCWYGDSPVKSLRAAVDDLNTKKSSAQSAMLPTVYQSTGVCGVADTFLDDQDAQNSYTMLDATAGDKFLVDYIARHDPKVFGMYGIIRDEMPKLSVYEKMQRQLYRLSHAVLDDNMYDGLDV